MAKEMPEDLPAQDRDHCHAIQDGDVLVDQWDATYRIELLDDGSVIATDDYGSEEMWSATELAHALRDGILHRQRDGKSWLLAG
jgi:hypothetical protein